MASSVAAFVPLGARILAPVPARAFFCSAAGASRTSRARIGLVQLTCAAGAGDGEARLTGLPRAELQALAKVHGLKANAKSDWIVAELLKAGVQPGESPTSPQEAAPSSVSETAPPSENVLASLSRDADAPSDVGDGAEDEEETELTEEREVAEETEEQLGARAIAQRLDGIGSITIEDELELFCMAASFAPRCSPTSSPPPCRSPAPSPPDPTRQHTRPIRAS
ncbi:hypothetical protein T484DRAFT_1741308 [Baffinella frigidus]|nr:hypothetical protein T484DRAFT_1741308 [Cryptophyta sp. CCMP2293]